MKKFLGAMLIAFSLSGHAGSIPDSLDEFTTKGIPLTLIGLGGQGYLSFALDSGQELTTTYREIEPETILEWEEQAKESGRPRKLNLIFTVANGVEVVDPESRIKFRLTGPFGPHPISLGTDECQRHDSSTRGLIHCYTLERDAWKSEIARSFSKLGGNGNEVLQESQSKWEQFVKAELELLRDAYEDRAGTIWGIEASAYHTGLYKERAQALAQFLNE